VLMESTRDQFPDRKKHLADEFPEHPSYVLSPFSADSRPGVFRKLSVRLRPCMAHN
jgi:hypothetical protein